MSEIIMHILENKDNLGPMVSFRRNGSMSCGVPLPPLLLIDSLSRKSFSYRKLPQEPLKLTIVKLDGSSFGIEVAKSASVAQLKQAVEAAFTHMPSKISWPHVWGSFCLYYKGYKLLDDKDYIGLYGMKDGDKIHFIRHASINFNLKKSRRETEDLDEENPRISIVSEESKQNGDDVDSDDSEESLKQQSDNDDDDDDDDDDDKDDENYNIQENLEYQSDHNDNEDDEYDHYRGNLNHQSDHNDNKEDTYLFKDCELRMSDLFTTCSSHRRLRSSRFDEKSVTNSPKFSNSCLGNFRKILCFRRKKRN